LQVLELWVSIFVVFLLLLFSVLPSVVYVMVVYSEEQMRLYYHLCIFE